ncbi:hypothetical protein [Agrobacterium tumefaciens]|uniref:hypothetical protein n=1 Tax=Agrobacterium tumefaciens TaxID=358 RepID=UPI002243BE88|nr:hypothetical protein [Agrobacterium tumefaciens]MCW8060426.1 hypothetical protein [Agrobacterium tumefaciens]MCW8145870.1 hypothetical protein [Agrobacterium tumefaciens]
MSLREDFHSTSSIPSARDGDLSNEKPASPALVLAGCSAISGAIVGFLLAGHIYASVFILISVLVASWIGWWARGLNDGS